MYTHLTNHIQSSSEGRGQVVITTKSQFTRISVQIFVCSLCVGSIKCIRLAECIYYQRISPCIKNYERLLPNINLLCYNVRAKLFTSLVQWIFSMMQNSYSCRIKCIGVPIIDYKELEELNIVQWWGSCPSKKANALAPFGRQGKNDHLNLI